MRRAKPPPSLPSEEETRAVRARAEEKFRTTVQRWPEVHDVSTALENARTQDGQDPFLEEVARAMRSRRAQREG